MSKLRPAGQMHHMQSTPIPASQRKKVTKCHVTAIDATSLTPVLKAVVVQWLE